MSGKSRLLIIGGTGEFGALYARLMKRKFDVGIISRDVDKARIAAEKIGVDACDFSEISNADIVIVSVPISAAVETVKKAIPLMKRDALLMDFTSVKVPVIKTMSEFEGEVAGCHPMHGPRVESLAGLCVVFVPVRKGPKYNEITQFFDEEGAKIYETSAEEHDKLLSVVQVLTHYIYISAGATIGEAGIDTKKLPYFSSPVFEITMDMVARVLGQNPHVYSQIQTTNPYASEIRKLFLENAEKLARISEDKNEEEFLSFFAKSAKGIGNIENKLWSSDKVISAMQHERAWLKSMIGRKIALKNLNSGIVHFGILEDVGIDRVRMRCGKRIFELNLPYVRVLNEQETRDWKIKSVEAASRDLSFVFEDYDDETLKEFAMGIDEDILDVNIVDKYEIKGKKSVTLRFSIFPERVKEVENKIKLKFKGIGAIIR
ncbi:MAG: prephenate dehydrogenase/arogenate dehydrogenase family protein [Candidatus Micrarchaeia archaeon]